MGSFPHQSKCIVEVKDLEDSAVEVKETSIFAEDISLEMPTSYILSSVVSGSRTIITHNKCPELSCLDYTTLLSRVFEHKQKIYLHFEGRNVENLLKWLNENKNKLESSKDQITVSLEFEKPERIGILDLLEFADICFFSKKFSLYFGHDSVEEFFKWISPKVPSK